MMCYKDSTFCEYYKRCWDGGNCGRALTPQVIKNAEEWWGDDNPPVSVFTEKPDCFVNKGITEAEFEAK